MFQKRYLRVFLTIIENEDMGSKRRQLYCVIYTKVFKISLLEYKGKHLLCREALYSAEYEIFRNGKALHFSTFSTTYSSFIKHIKIVRIVISLKLSCIRLYVIHLFFYVPIIFHFCKEMRHDLNISCLLRRIKISNILELCKVKFILQKKKIIDETFFMSNKDFHLV